MASFFTLITTLGQAKLAAAISAGTALQVSQMALGDGNGHATTPTVSQTALVREVYRGTLQSFSVDPNNANYLIAELIVPTTVGGWAVNEVGLFDADGAMIAVGNFPSTYKPVLAEGSARDLVIRMVIEFANTAAMTLTVDASLVLASRKWVSDNFALAVVMPGGTTGMVLRKKSNASGDVEWYDPTAGTNILVNAIQEEQTLAASQTVVTLAIARTTGAAIYINGLRLRPSEFTITSTTQLTLATSYSAGTHFLAVQNNPESTVDVMLASHLFSEIAALGAAAKKTALENLGIITTQTALGYSSAPVLDFSGAPTRVLALTGAAAFTTSNRAAPKELRIFVKAGTTASALSFESGWHWQNAAGAPTTIAANKIGILVLTCLGAATTDVIAGWSCEP